MDQSWKIGARFVLAVGVLLGGMLGVGPAFSDEGRPPRPALVEGLPAARHYQAPNSSLPGSSQMAEAASPALPVGLGDWSQLAFESLQADFSQWEVYLARGDGSYPTRLTYHNASDIQARLNRGGTRVVFASNRDGDYEIFAMNPDGSGLVQLTSNRNSDVLPDWSPDGSKIVFQSNRDGQYEVYVMNADGSGLTRLTNSGSYDGEPAWSPDGSRIAFSSDRGGYPAIWVMFPDGFGLTQLSVQAYAENPAWSPDGSRIAYDADSDGNYFLEVWMMNANGADPRQVYTTYGDTDCYVRSWSPDGQYILYSRVSWIYYDGDWYWTEAYMDAVDPATPWTYIRLSASGVDWASHWQTLDVTAPQISLMALPVVTPYQFDVEWSAVDPGGAGVREYDVEYSDNGGPWYDWAGVSAQTSATFTGEGGHSYAFRVAAVDYALNRQDWSVAATTHTLVEDIAPRTRVYPLPEYSREGFALSWGGDEPGGSGIREYLVQVRRVGYTSWSDWLQTGATSAVFDGNMGAEYEFRVRAVDFALNVEDWPAGADARTTIYSWLLDTHFTDVSGTPIGGVQSDSNIDYFSLQTDLLNGRQTYYFSPAYDPLEIGFSKAGYTSLPATAFPFGRDSAYSGVLPPGNNLIQDWGFESGVFSPAGWQVSGTISASLDSAALYSGELGLRLSEPPGDFFTAPITLSNPTQSSHLFAMDAGLDGAVHAVWAAGSTIQYRQLPPGADWTLPVVAATQPAPIEELDVGVDGSGAVHLAWRRADGVFYARRPFGGAWSSPHTLQSGETLEGPVISVTDGGVAHVIWQMRSDDWAMRYARRDVGGTWSATDTLAYPHYDGWTDLGTLQLEAAENGAVHAFWSDAADTGYWGAFYAHRPAGGIWNVDSFTSNFGHVLQPVMTLDGLGLPHLVWGWQGAGFEIHHLYRGDEGTWLEETIPADGDASYPRAAAAADGSLHVLYQRLADWSIYYAYRSPQGVWATSEMVPALNSAARLDVGIDDQGVFHVLKHISEELSHYRRDVDGAWSDGVVVSGGHALANAPQLLVEPQGPLHLMWSDSFYVFYTGSGIAEDSGAVQVSQRVIIPPEMTAPQLSALFKIGGAPLWPHTGFEILLEDGLQAATLYSSTLPSGKVETGWQRPLFDLSAWSGETVTLTLRLRQASGYPQIWADLDEISLGSVFPDVFAILKGGKNWLSPGETMTYTLAYANQGGAPAAGVAISLTLPAGLTFVDADLAPSSSSAGLVTWQLGELPAKFASPIQVRLQADPGGDFPAHLSAVVQIALQGLELETANNFASTEVHVARRQFLPALVK